MLIEGVKRALEWHGIERLMSHGTTFGSPFSCCFTEPSYSNKPFKLWTVLANCFSLSVCVCVCVCVLVCDYVCFTCFDIMCWFELILCVCARAYMWAIPILKLTQLCLDIITFLQAFISSDYTFDAPGRVTLTHLPPASVPNVYTSSPIGFHSCGLFQSSVGVCFALLNLSPNHSVSRSESVRERQIKE